MTEPALDEELRGRLSKLAKEGAPELDELARRRVLSAVRREAASGPPWWRTPLLAVAAAAAAALIFFLFARQDASTPDGPDEPPTARRDCDAWAPAAGEGLGPRGSYQVDGELSVAAPDGCTTELTLARGVVDVHARDLGGGVLRVLAGPAVVEVRGTRFAVSHDASRVAVSVTEGHVVVSVGEEPEVHLRAGDSWERRAEESAGVESGVGALIAEVGVDRPLGPNEPAAETPPEPRSEARPRRPEPSRADRVEEEPAAPTAAQELARAEELWRRGERAEARQIFRQVGSGAGSIAEAAWVRLARLELRAGDARAARVAAQTQRRRFASGRLAAEALYLIFQASERLGDEASARAAREELLRRFGDSPQARSVGSAE